MYGNLKHAYFSARNPFLIPIKCSISMIRKWYVSIALKCKVYYLRRQVSYLLRHLLTIWLTTQGVNIISAAYAQSMQSIIKAFYNPLK